MFQLEQVGAVPNLGEVLKHNDHAQSKVHLHTNLQEKKQMTLNSDNNIAQHKILRLEKNISWLQDQHGQMVSALHKEIETLKQRNKELQFQFIMNGGNAPAPTTAETTQAETGKTPVTLPPILTNLGAVAPLQADILDREIKELQSALHEAKSRNIFLTSVVEQQKKKLAELESEIAQEKTPVPSSSVSVGQQSEPLNNIPSDLLRKLAEAEGLVTQLQQQNASQREELDAIHSSLEKEARMKYRGCNHPARSFRYRNLSSNSSFDGGSSRDLAPQRTRNSSQDSQYISASRLDLSRNSDRFPPLKALAVPRSRRQSNISRDLDSEVGGSDTSLHSHQGGAAALALPRLGHYNSQPTIQSHRQTPKREQGPPRVVKTIIKRLPREQGPRYGSLDRQHSRS